MATTNETQAPHLYCYSCKTPVTETDRYCSKCGAFKPWKKSAPEGLIQLVLMRI